MNLVIIGQKWLAAEVLKAVTARGLNVIGVAPEGRDQFSKAAQALNIPAFDLPDIPSCGLVLAAHGHRFVPAPVRRRAGFGVLAYHPSLLPRHRGRDAVHWTLAMGDPIAGGTVYWMDDGADTGPIEAQDWCFTRPGDTPQILWRRDLGPLGVRLLADTAASLAAGHSPRRLPQDESLATWEPALSRVKLSGG